MQLPSTEADVEFIFDQVQKIVDAESRKAGESQLINDIKKELKDYDLETADINLLVKFCRRKADVESEKERVESVAAAYKLMTGEDPEAEED